MQAMNNVELVSILPDRAFSCEIDLMDGQFESTKPLLLVQGGWVVAVVVLAVAEGLLGEADMEVGVDTVSLRQLLSNRPTYSLEGGGFNQGRGGTFKY